MKRLIQLGIIGMIAAFGTLLVAPAARASKQATNDQSTLTLKVVKKKLKRNKKYLKEAQTKGKAGDTKGMETALTNYDRGMTGLTTALNKGQFQGSPSQLENAYNRVAAATQKHEAMLSKLMNKVPTQAQSAISNAMSVSEKGHNTATAQLQSLQTQRGMGQANRPDFGQSNGHGMGRPEGAGQPGGMGGFGAGNAPMGGPVGGGAMGHPGGGPAMGGGHPGR